MLGSRSAPGAQPPLTSLGDLLDTAPLGAPPRMPFLVLRVAQTLSVRQPPHCAKATSSEQFPTALRIYAPATVGPGSRKAVPSSRLCGGWGVTRLCQRLSQQLLSRGSAAG